VKRAAAASGAALVLIALAGCGDLERLTVRYRVEQILWKAQREESAARLSKEKPDSTTLLRLRSGYEEASKIAPPPYTRGTDSLAIRVGHDIARTVGFARLQASRLAVEANRPDLAIAELKAVEAMAEGDTLIRRQADFFLAGTYRQYGRTLDAVALFREMLRKYPPSPPGANGTEDAMLSIPDAIVRLLRESGDEAGANQERVAARAYYLALLQKPAPPTLEAQIRARLVRTDLELQDWSAAVVDVERLDSLVAATPSLTSLQAEVQYSKAKVRGVRDRNPKEAAAKLDSVAARFPDSRFAALALVDAGALLEKAGDKKGALAHYREASTKYPNDQTVAPVAAYRRAILEDEQGNWAAAKILLESIPVRYPRTQAGVEAPVAIARRYFRVGQRDAGMAALRKAIETYQAMIARDTSSAYCTMYRWAILQCRVTLGDWITVLQAVDDMAGHDMGHPSTAEALLHGATVARDHNRPDLAKRYLEMFLANYPNSPAIPDVKKRLAQLSQTGGRGG
jgi:TolA-binding protein